MLLDVYNYELDELVALKADSEILSVKFAQIRAHDKKKREIGYAINQ